MEKYQRNINSYYISIFIEAIAIALPHAVLTILLLKKGISLSDIMLIQSIYSLTIILCEYPSGLIADLFSKKKIFMMSRVFLILMFLLVIFGNNLTILMVAWIFYGIFSALDSGTVDVAIINKLKQNGHEQFISKFIGNYNRLNFIGLLIGSSIGSFLYFKIGLNFYFISICFTVLSIIIIGKFFEENKTNPKVKLKLKDSTNTLFEQVKEGFYELKSSYELRLMIGLTFVGQFFFQAHFQLWQGLFLSEGINKHHFYLFYIIFQIISVLAYSMPTKKIKQKTFLFTTMFILMTAALVGLHSKYLILFIGSYFILVFIFTVFDYLSNFLFSKKVSIQHISSLTSLKSTIGRIAAMISMLLSSILLNYMSAINVVSLNFLIAIICSFVLYSAIC